MIVVAGITLTFDWPISTALLIFVSTLLDGVDGYVARKYHQCTIFGSGIDWFGDVLYQVMILVWWFKLDSVSLLFNLFFTILEVGNSIFDFAVTAKGRYPSMKKNYDGFMKIIEWTMADNKISYLNWIIWLAHPIWALSCCLSYYFPLSSLLFYVKLISFVPAIMYIWCEAAFFVMTISNWSENY